MITVVDYGMGNLRSVARAFEAAGAAVRVTGDAEDLARAERIVVPGVGAFGDAMDELARRSLLWPLRDAIAAGKPTLGICLGLQILFDVGEEYGEHAGLGVLSGRVVRFVEPSLKVPHMGWNRVNRTADHAHHAVLAAVPDGAYFYFVHSYYAAPAEPSDVAATTDYGAPFASAVARDNVVAVQFHPEKSQAAGLALVAAFARWKP